MPGERLLYPSGSRDTEALVEQPVVATSDNRIRSVAAATRSLMVIRARIRLPAVRRRSLARSWRISCEPLAGRIVLPLSIRGIQLSVGLDSAGDHLVSRSACCLPGRRAPRWRQSEARAWSWTGRMCASRCNGRRRDGVR